MNNNFKLLAKKFKFFIFLFIYIGICGCHSSQLSVKIINLTNKRLYVGNLLSNCDSCDIIREVRFQCNDKDSNPPTMRVLPANDSLLLVDKLLPAKIRIFTLNADSLNKFCGKGLLDVVIKKSWLHTYTGDVNLKTKSCTIFVK